MEYVTWAVVHLGLWSLMLLSAFGIGRVLLRKHSFDSTVERIVFTTALGLGSAAFIIFLLGLAGLMYRGLLIGITIPWGLFSLVSLARETNLPRVRDWLTRLRTHPLRAATTTLLFIAGFSYWVCLLVGTQFPPAAWDSTDEHLVVAREFLAAHRPVALLGIIEPVLPNLNHSLFVWGMALKDDILAQMIAHTFMMLTAIGLYAWGRRRESSWSGLALGAFWLGSPLVLWLGQTAYVDLCLVCFGFLGVYALRIFWENHDTKWWYLAMALCAMAAGSKLAGLFFAAAGMITGALVFALRRLSEKLKRGEKAASKQLPPEPIRLKTVATGWAICLLVLAPWYGFIFFHTGNPVWPAFAQFSRGIWGTPALVEFMKVVLTHPAEPRTITSFLTLPLKWFTRPAKFGIGGIPTPLNPLIIIWPIVWVVALWNREVRWWTIWALIFTLYWFFSAQDLRYWLPGLPIVGVALLESLRWIIKRTRTVKWSPAVYLLLAIFSIGWGSRYIVPVTIARSPPPVTAENRERWLSRVGGYDAAAYINRHAKHGDVVALVYGPWLAYHLKPPVFDLFGFLQTRDDRFPVYSWPQDQQWIRWIESHNSNWILVIYDSVPAYVGVPKTDPAAKPFWPNYQLVYSRRDTWVFRQKPLPPDVEEDLVVPASPR
jgi:Dolichyl-phosphate-mannose-protein mannosyltransferase